MGGMRGGMDQMEGMRGGMGQMGGMRGGMGQMGGMRVGMGQMGRSCGKGGMRGGWGIWAGPAFWMSGQSMGNEKHHASEHKEAHDAARPLMHRL